MAANSEISPVIGGNGAVTSENSRPSLQIAWQAYSEMAWSKTPDRRSRAPESLDGEWVSANESAKVAGRKIGGMVYVGASYADDSGRRRSRVYIDPSLPVAGKARDGDLREGPDSEYYSGMNPLSRAAYLEWLSGDRSDPDVHWQYVWSYFYGLERRFFVDKPPKEEMRKIVDEVMRLIDVRSGDEITRNFFGKFVEVARVAIGDVGSFEPAFPRDEIEYSDKLTFNMPLSISFPVSVRMNGGEGIAADWALNWLLFNGRHRLTGKVWRCFEEFRALFVIRFDGRFPEGMKFPKSDCRLQPGYSALSQEFNLRLDIRHGSEHLRDYAQLAAPLEIILEIADEVMGELEGLTSFLARKPKGRSSFEAHMLLPSSLRKLFPCERLEGFRPWVADIAAAGDLVNLAQILERLEGASPRKLGKKRMDFVAGALEHLGYGLAPDPRYDFAGPEPELPVAVYELSRSAEAPERIDGLDRYRRAVMELALGSFVVHCEGSVTGAERMALGNRIESAARELGDRSRRQLQANLDRFLLSPPSLPFLRRNLEDLDGDYRDSMRSAAVAAAQADGEVRPGQVAAIEKIYEAMEIDPALAYSDLHVGATEEAAGASWEPLSERTAETVRGSVDFELDARRISAIRSDTERASAALGGIFDAENERKDAGGRNVAASFPGLDRKLVALVGDLVKQERWTQAAFERLCERRGLLAAGALESVNEWAFDVHGEALLDERDGYDVSAGIAESLRNLLHEEGGDAGTEAA